MGATQKIVLISLVVLIIGYFGYTSILRKSIKSKLGTNSQAASNDIDNLSLPELRHFNKVVDLFLEIRDKDGVEEAMPSLSKMKEMIEDQKMKSIMNKTGNLKNFSMLGTEFISKIK